MKDKIIKNWFLLAVIFVTLARFLFSFYLPSFYIENMAYDDQMMVGQSTSLVEGRYLGDYSDTTLEKGIVFPLVLAFSRITHISYSIVFTTLFILSIIYFIRPFEKLTKNKVAMLIFYILLLFNPITYSSELFQRLYRNSLSIIELFFFLGAVIRVILSDDKGKKAIVNYLILGLILAIMSMTREDTVWGKVIVVLLIIYKYFKSKDIKGFKDLKKLKHIKPIKPILLGLIPFIVVFASQNVVSFINYKVYGIYTYNELQSSEFKKTYKKILSIKDDKKLDYVSIPKSTLIKIAEYTKGFMGVGKVNIYYKIAGDSQGEIYNGNILWYIREMADQENHFGSGEKSEEYYTALGEELDKLFEKGIFEKEFIFPSVFLNVPTANELAQLPKSIFNIITYTTSYDGVRTFLNFNGKQYNDDVNAYKIHHFNSHSTGNILTYNDWKYEIPRVVYMLLAIIFSPIALIAYIWNIKKKDKFNLISTIVLLVYLMILAGTAYTDVSAFPTLRYLCLGNLYVLQMLFIALNIYRLRDRKEELVKIKNRIPLLRRIHCIKKVKPAKKAKVVETKPAKAKKTRVVRKKKTA